MTPFDALVVGAGPAGSVAALVLARSGLRVRLIDRARFPRHKLCGDTMNPGALAILDELAEGGGREAAALPATVGERALPITGMTVTGPGGVQVTGEYPGGLRGAALTRSDLDMALIHAATSAGAVLSEGLSAHTPILDGDGRAVGVRAGRNGSQEHLHARVVIVADGRGSKLSAALGLSAFARRPRRWAFGSYFTDVDGITARGEMHIRGDGYIGVAPLPDGAVNVCVVREVAPGSGTRRFDQSRVIGDALAADPALCERFASARSIAPVSTLGPLAVESHGSGIPGLLLAGDAAGFVNPMTGDGLRFALRGGILAANAALSELASGRAAFADLDAARMREFAAKWRINRAIRLLAGSPRALAIAALVTGQWAAPVRYLIGVAGDVRGVSRREGHVPPRHPRGDPESAF